jgi:hypothetical protein
MKINPVAIQSYQQLARRQEPNTAQPENSTNEPAGRTVTIKPQGEVRSSRLAVRVPGRSYAEFLTPEERQALDLLFSRFKNGDRFGASYRAEEPATENAGPVGRLIDVKV